MRRIYLHRRIVQDQQSARPRHPHLGYYELQEILDTFRARGFVVSGEIRPRSATVSDSADLVVEQVRRHLESGTPADRVMVVGGSMGSSTDSCTGPSPNGSSRSWSGRRVASERPWV